MPAIIDSAPSCITDVAGAQPADDSADFIIQAAYENCAGIMTFGPGSTWGEEGASAGGAYYLLTWLGIAFMVIALIAWVVYEHKRLVERAAGARGEAPGPSQAPEIAN